MKILVSFLLFPFCSFGQKTFTGIVSSENGINKVPYATIGLIKENIGINADENGYFILNSASPKLNDTLIISSCSIPCHSSKLCACELPIIAK